MVVAELPNVDASHFSKWLDTNLTRNSKTACVSELVETSTISKAFEEVQGTGITTARWVYASSSNSGGTIYFDSSRDRSNPVITFLDNADKKISKSTQLIMDIKTAFELSDSELASIFDASRKSVHNWTNTDQKPSKSKLARIVQVYDVLNSWKENGYPIDSESIRTPADNSPSLLEMLSQDNINKDKILFLGSKLMLDKGFENELEDPFA
ncbi:hypothetical protein ACOW3S_004418 [Vibrio fluvialis]|nr:hypothetical protein [Vibrio fluvialis]